VGGGCLDARGITGNYFIYYFTNGRYVDYLSLTYATNKNRILKLRYRYYIKKLSIYIYIYIYIFICLYRSLMMRSSHKNSNSNKEEAQSVFHNFCPGLPVLLTLCPIK
jgi:hypothetical protein